MARKKENLQLLNLMKNIRESWKMIVMKAMGDFIRKTRYILDLSHRVADMDKEKKIFYKQV